MAERWLLAGPGELAGEVRSVELDPVEAHHARAVLRLRPGDPVVVTDGRGRVAEAVVGALRRDRLQIDVTAVRTVAPPPVPGPVLVHGVLAGRGMDWAVQKAVEVGVTAMRPLLAARSQLGHAAVRGRMEHWRRIARQALKQCRRPWEMELLEPAGVVEVVAAAPGRGAVADSDGRPLWRAPAEALEHLLVGPEGGLTPDEVAFAGRHGWVPVRLGPHVMRSETAAVAGAAAALLERERRAG